MDEREFQTPAVRSEIKPRTGAAPSAGILGLQRAAGNQSVSSLLEEREPSPVKDLLASSSGQPLDRDTQALMQDRLGHDFSDVRVHAGSQATESAKSVNAHAYTVGTDVVFQADKYSPGTESGQKMLAHELTHVVQQKAGPVDGTPAPGGISVSHPSDAFEQAAERSAEKAMSAPAQGPVATQASVQREEAAEEEDETAQRVALQREAADEEDWEA